MHAMCLIVEPIAKKDENICCNHVVVPDFVPIVCSTSKNKSVYIPPHKRNQKVERKNVKKFQKNLSKLFCENDDLITKFSESNKLVEKYKKLTENSLEKLKEFECLNIDLDAKLILSNKLVDELKCEN